MELPKIVTAWPERLAEIESAYRARRQELNQQADALLRAAEQAERFLSPSAEWLAGTVTESAERLAQSRAMLPVVAARLRQAVEDRLAVEKEHVAGVVALVEAARPAAVEARKLMDAELPRQALDKGASPELVRTGSEDALAHAAALTAELRALRVVEAAVAPSDLARGEPVVVHDAGNWLRGAPEHRASAVKVDPNKARVAECRLLANIVKGG